MPRLHVVGFAPVALALSALAALGVGCPRAPTATPTFTLPFLLRDGAEAVACGRAGRFTLEDARFHVSAMTRGRGASRSPVEFEPDGRAQSRRVARLDFEDGTAACRAGDPEVHTTLVLRGAPPVGETLAFDLAVPFRENHGNPALAAAPLTAGTMHWGWRGGYKFARLEGRLDGLPLRVHVGSTGCEGPFTAVTRCAHPNVAHVELPDYRPGRAVVIDLGSLLDAGATDCMGELDDPACATAYRLLGLRGEPMQLVRWAAP